MSENEKNIDGQIKAVSEKLQKAQEEQNVGAEFAPDYIDLQGVRFFKPKVAHIWVFERLQHYVDGFPSLDDFGSCLVYTLAHNQDTARNKIMREITRRQIIDNAFEFICKKELTKETIDTVLETYCYKVLNISVEDDEENQEKKEMADQASPHSGGLT